MAKERTPGVVFQPAAYQALQGGIDQLVNVVRPTLGPRPRVVAIDPIVKSRSPELLDDAGVIARRIIQLPNRGEDMGAMLVRRLLWRIHDQFGDGAATAAVIFQSIYNQGLRYIVAGGSPALLRRHLDGSIRVILDELTGMSFPLEGKAGLAQVAESICYDPVLAKTLGEIFDIIGEHGQLDTRSGRSREIKREYVEGMYWKGSVFSRLMITDLTELRVKLDNAAILMTDIIIKDPRLIAPVVAMAMKANKGNTSALAAFSG